MDWNVSVFTSVLISPLKHRVLALVGIQIAFCFCDENNNENQSTTRDGRCYGSLHRNRWPKRCFSNGQRSATVKTFEKRAKDYVKLREQLEEKMPKLSQEAKAEEIQAHKKQFQDRVRAARAGAKPGDVFTPEAVTLIRAIIKDEYKGAQRVELRDTVLRSQTPRLFHCGSTTRIRNRRRCWKWRRRFCCDCHNCPSSYGIASLVTTCCSSIARTD